MYNILWRWIFFKEMKQGLIKKYEIVPFGKQEIY